MSAIALSGYSQKVWSLKACIDRAVDQSINVELSDLTVDGSLLSIKLAEQLRYPNLSAGSDLGWNFGRTIDPTRNEFVTETFFNNGFSLNSGVSLYNGGFINNSIKQSRIDALASKADAQQARSDIALQVANFYLTALLAQENLANAQKQLTLTEQQRDALNKQIAVGNRPENDVLDLEAQLATNEQSIVDAQNNLNIALLNLKQILRLEPDDQIVLEVPANLSAQIDPDLVSFDEVYNAALGQQTSVRAGELRMQSAQMGEKIAQASAYPSIGAGVNASTNFSNKGVFADGFTPIINEQEVFINGQSVTVGFPGNTPNLKNTPYFTQIGDNVSYALGVRLNVPIYDNFKVRGGIQRAKQATQKSAFQLEQIKNNLSITVGQAIADAKAAKARLNATIKSLNASTLLYENAKKRFDIGSLNVFELTRLKTQMESAQINATNAKYDYLFRTKVIEFYLGRPIQL
jgi:outer membrane protein